MKLDNKIFELAKEAGIEALEIYVNKSYSLSFSLFHSELDSYSLANAQTLSARGIVNGHMGYAYSEKIDKTTPEYIVRQIVENAKNIDKDETPSIFKGSEKYKKFNPFNEGLSLYPIEKKIQLLHTIEDKLKTADPRITEIGGCQYEESANELYIANSYGLKLKQKSNYFVVYAEAVASDKEEVKTGYKIKLGNDITSFNVDAFVQDIAKEVTSKLGGKPCASKSYRTVLSPKVVANLLSALLSSAKAREVQKHSSLLEGKLNEAIASKHITIYEDPTCKNIFNRYFDDEGVATYKKALVEKGVLKTYVYNLETAAIDGVESTGNGYRSGAKGAVGTGFVNITLKPGNKSEEELMSKIKEGVYISEVTGLHAGLNAQSGNFSLQASGFMIRDGKIAEPINLITVAGNLLQLFKDVIGVANNSELQTSSYTTSSLLIKKLAISGK